MEIILAVFVFQQIPITYADTTWPMYGATLENTHYQKMVGAMNTAPIVKWFYQTGSEVECYGPAVTDVDGDGTMEVVVGSHDSKVYCLNGVTGRVKWSYQTGGPVHSAPAVADVDGDDIMEVVVGSEDGELYCLNGVTGGVEWSYTIGSFSVSSPAIADVDGDDTLEVVVANWNGRVYCLNGVTGALKWSYTTGYFVISSPAVADVNMDDTLEVVVGSEDSIVYCLNGVTGALKWSHTTGGRVVSSPAIADIDGDGAMEVVIGSCDGKVYCLNGVTGGVEWSYTTGNGVWSSAAVADVDRDGTVEVIIGSDDKVYCLDGIAGALKWSYYTGGTVHRGISVADLDGDYGECKLEVLVPDRNTDSLVCLNGEDGSVLWKKQLTQDVHDITIADIDNDGCVELIVGTQRLYTIWALDDVGNRSDCKCDNSGVEEKRELRVKGLEFRVMGRGVYLFTPNAISVDIKLYDVCGRLKQVIYKGVLSKGGHTFMPDIKHSGIYFVVLNSQGMRESIKLINLGY